MERAINIDQIKEDEYADYQRRIAKRLNRELKGKKITATVYTNLSLQFAEETFTVKEVDCEPAYNPVLIAEDGTKYFIREEKDIIIHEEEKEVYEGVINF